MDYAHIMQGGIPHQFNWWVFATGLGLGSLSYFSAARPKLSATQPAPKDRF